MPKARIASSAGSGKWWWDAVWSGDEINVVKHGGYGLEHVFCNHWRCSRNLYLLMRMVHDVGNREDSRAVPRRHLRRMDI